MGPEQPYHLVSQIIVLTFVTLRCQIFNATVTVTRWIFNNLPDFWWLCTKDGNFRCSICIKMQHRRI